MSSKSESSDSQAITELARAAEAAFGAWVSARLCPETTDWRTAKTREFQAYRDLLHAMNTLSNALKEAA